MYDFSTEEPIDREALRKRLRRMDDQQLCRWGRAARHMCSPEANLGRPPQLNYVIQLEEAIAEWKRRHGGGQTIPGAPRPDCNGGS